MRRRLACVWSICVLLAAAANVHAADDIVAYASDVTAMQGNWTRAASSSGAGGQLMTGSDYGWSATSAALESPNDYFEVPVSASANTPYHVWVRMRASGDSKWNDSVWLQFSDAVASNGGGLYRIGSTSGLLLNLESCSGCGTSGWGWVDGAEPARTDGHRSVPEYGDAHHPRPEPRGRRPDRSDCSQPRHLDAVSTRTEQQ